ncbi:MAG TPA: phage holin family protein [Thermomicrobiales bacterium]|nr:phage holin family protein [Thermomicrobiales bacterium]
MSEERYPEGSQDIQAQRRSSMSATDYGTPTSSRPTVSADGNDSRSIAEMFSGAVHNIQNIVRAEVQLAKTELREEAKVAGKGAAMLGAAAVVGIYALGLFLLTAVYALAQVMADWLAALIVAVVVAAVAGVLAMVGKSRLQQFSPKPDQTIDSVKEDIEWVKQQTP